MAILYYILKLRGKFDLCIDCENGIPFFTPLFVNIPTILLIHHVHREVHRNQLVFPLSHLAIFLESVLMPLMYKNQKLITVSESSKNDIIRLGLGTPDSISVINPGVDNNKFFVGKKTQDPSFIYLGRLAPYKNIDIAIKAFARLLHNYVNAQLIIAGDGEVRASLDRLTEELGITNSVTFTGRITDEQRAELLSSSWACIQPSSFEGWGITTVEANASGTLVIASDVNGLKDSVVKDRTGVLFPAKNIEKLCDSMTLVIENRDYREYLSQEAIIWSKQFSWDMVAKRFEQAVIEYITIKELMPAFQFVKRNN
jgi:glycosyltransferase involved in cell wall biosynthesis